MTGDSEAEFLGQRLTDQSPPGLLQVETVARNATGLTNPSFFNWELNAQQEVDARDPDAVVMAIGGNDGFNVESGGNLYGPHDPGWETEFARRVAVVAGVLSGDGERPVYWVPPPTARDPEFNEIYKTQNRAVEKAEAAVPGLRYVDVYSTLGKGKYSDDLKIDGQKVLARQPDGVHFTRDGAVAPVRLILKEMARDFPALERTRGRDARSSDRGRGPGAVARARRRLDGGRACESVAQPQPARERRLAGGRHAALPSGELRRWRVSQSTSVSRHAYEGPGVMRAYGSSLPRVIHVSLGTNDDPRQTDSFRSAIRQVMAVAGPRRCVVWTNIVRPPVAGASYAGYNRALAEESRPRENLRVVNWARMMRQNSSWSAADGVHVTATGYQARANAIARSVRRCR